MLPGKIKLLGREDGALPAGGGGGGGGGAPLTAPSNMFIEA